MFHAWVAAHKAQREATDRRSEKKRFTNATFGKHGPLLESSCAEKCTSKHSSTLNNVASRPEEPGSRACVAMVEPSMSVSSVKNPRQRLTMMPVTGRIWKWNGKFGWIYPDTPIEHELAGKHHGKIYVARSDFVQSAGVVKGSQCCFQVYSTDLGLGAEDCFLMGGYSERNGLHPVVEAMMHAEPSMITSTHAHKLSLSSCVPPVGSSIQLHSLRHLNDNNSYHDKPERSPRWMGREWPA